MAWFIDFNVRDSKGKPARMRIPVTAGTLPTGYNAYATAVASAIFGTGNISLGGYLGASLVADLGLPALTAIAGSEARDKWQASMLSVGNPPFRFSVPVSNPLDTLVVAGSQVIADLSQTPFTNAIAALIDTAGTVHMVEPDEGTTVSGWGPVISQVRSRKRPRVGGSR